MTQSDHELFTGLVRLDLNKRASLARFIESPVVISNREPASLDAGRQTLLESIDFIYQRLCLFDSLSHDLGTMEIILTEMKTLSEFVSPILHGHQRDPSPRLRAFIDELNRLRTDYSDSLLSQGLYTARPIGLVKSIGENIQRVTRYIRNLYRFILMDTVNPIGRRSKREREEELNKLLQFEFTQLGNNTTDLNRQTDALIYAIDFMTEAEVGDVITTPTSTVNWVIAKSDFRFMTMLQSFVPSSCILQLNNIRSKVLSQENLYPKNMKEDDVYLPLFRSLESALGVIKHQTQVLLRMTAVSANITEKALETSWYFLAEACPYLESSNGISYHAVIRDHLKIFSEYGNGKSHC